MKKYSLGIFLLGHTKFEIFVWPTSNFGARFDAAPAQGRPYIDIALGEDEWPEVLELALHEAFEAECILSGLRFATTGAVARDHGSYRFFLDHVQFTEVCARVAPFLAKVLPPLAKAYKKARKK